MLYFIRLTPLFQLSSTQFSTASFPGDIWQCLEMFLVVTTRGGKWEVLPASDGPRMWPNTLQWAQDYPHHHHHQRTVWPEKAAVLRSRNRGLHYSDGLFTILTLCSIS